jgi:hypothetical protein
VPLIQAALNLDGHAQHHTRRPPRRSQRQKAANPG